MVTDYHSLLKALSYPSIQCLNKTCSQHLELRRNDATRISYD